MRTRAGVPNAGGQRRAGRRLSRCLDVCDTEQFDVTPTQIDGASDAAARPWLEVNGGLSNESIARVRLLAEGTKSAAHGGIQR